jgi:hypothetical protein
VSSLSDALTYDSPYISSVRTHNTSLDLSSRGFPMHLSLAALNNTRKQHADYSSSARLEASGCEATSWRSSFQVTCQVPSGLFETCRAAIVTTAVSVGSVTRAFTYLPLWLTGGHPSNVVRGLAHLQVFGFNFAGFECSPAVRVGASSAEATLWASDTSVSAIAGAGSRSLLMMRMTILQLQSETSEAATYDIVEVLGALQSKGNLPASPQSSAQGMLDLFTVSLGTSDPTSALRLAGTAALMTQWRSDTSARGRYTASYSLTLSYSLLCHTLSYSLLCPYAVCVISLRCAWLLSCERMCACECTCVLYVRALARFHVIKVQLLFKMWLLISHTTYTDVRIKTYSVDIDVHTST